MYGNFVNRALQLTQKYYNGIVPECGELTEHDKVTLADIAETKRKAELLIEQFKFREAQKEVLNLARVGNRYIADEEPWKVIKIDEARVKTILYVSLQITASLAILFEPFLPFSGARLRNLLNLGTAEWDSLDKGELLLAGTQLQRPELLFCKVEDEEIRFQTDKLAATIAANRQKGIG